MRVLRVHGGKPKYFHALIGGNFRIDELQAAVLRVKLKYLDGWTEGGSATRRTTTNRLRRFRAGREIAHAAGAMAGQRHIFNQYIVRVKIAMRSRRISPNAASARRSTIRCPASCRSASRIRITRRGFSAFRARRRRNPGSCRSIRN
jgi:dTDP-4-amino-4,6-dideoxygalactose transaminase